MNKKLFFSVAMALALNSTDMYAAVNLFPDEMNLEGTEMVVQKDNVGKYICQRPKEKNRLFKSDAVEKKIKEIKSMLKNPYLAWMFENCFPNTLDTTVHFRELNGKPDTFVYTGDIHAMWLRDSGAQVWPYVQLANDDPKLKEMLEGVIRRQFLCINIIYTSSKCVIFNFYICHRNLTRQKSIIPIILSFFNRRCKRKLQDK